MEIQFKIRVKGSNATAKIDEVLNINSNDEALKNELQTIVEYVQSDNRGYISPVLLDLYNELKRNPAYKINPSKGAVSALKRKPKETEIN